MSMEQEDPIARIAASQLGAAPQAPAAPPPPPSAPEKDTAVEIAQTDAAPKTEADAANEEPYTFIEVTHRGEKKQFTPNQITGTLDRYTALNNKHMNMKPLIDVAENMANTTGKPMGEVMNSMLDLMRKGLGKNTQLGGDATQSARPGADTPAPQNADNAPDPFANWEAENDVSLPPGYREQQKMMGNLTQQVAQMTNLMQGVLQQAQGTAQGAVEKEANAIQMAEQAMRERVKINLDRLADKHGLTEEDAEKFNVYILEGGYLMNEMADPTLAERVVADFARAKNGPEYERLKAINERRQAYQGTMAAAPAEGAGPAPAPEDPFLARATDKALSGRMG